MSLIGDKQTRKARNKRVVLDIKKNGIECIGRRVLDIFRVSLTTEEAFK